MKTLLLKFSGPLQAWGTNSHFETRATDFYPSKSGVIGFLSACLGYCRDEDEKIQTLNDLDFAVRVDQDGRLLRDYQIASKWKNDGSFDTNYVTERYYLEDAVFVVALASEDDPWMEELALAVQHPYFQPYLGRRSAPPTADVVIGLFDETAMEALREFPWQAQKWFQKEGNRIRPIYADTSLIGQEEGKFRRDRVLSFSQKKRQFGFRGEASTTIELELQEHQTEHDAFSAIGE